MNKQFAQSLAEPARSILSEMESGVSRTLTTLGIFPIRKGHGQLLDAILYHLAQYPAGTANNLYCTVSRWHNCTPKALESAMRNALRAAHNSGMLMRINALVGAPVADSSYIPSNLQFISLIAQYCYYKAGANHLKADGPDPDNEIL